MDRDDQCICSRVGVTMPTRQNFRPNVFPLQPGSGDTGKGADGQVGFFDNGIPPQLYFLWRTQRQRV